MSEEHSTVRITIDGKPKVSPNPTTGEALYRLGDVKPDYVLYLATPGHGNDDPIPNDGTVIELKEGSRLFTARKSLNPG